MSAPTILMRCNPLELTENPFSLSIYGVTVDKDFLDSVRKYGIQEPVVVASDGKTLLSGHRRRWAAITCQIKEIPVLVRKDVTSGMAIQRAVLEYNRHRVKDARMIAAEVAALAAAYRQEISDRTPPHKEVDKAVADEANVSAEQVRKVRKSMDVVQKALESGNEELAKKIESSPTVHSAYQTAMSECPKGGPHAWEDGACSKCHEPTKAKPAAKNVSGESPLSRHFEAFEDGYARMVRGLDAAATSAGHGSKSYAKQCLAVAGLLLELVQAWSQGRAASPKEFQKCVNSVKNRFPLLEIAMKERFPEF